jgi:hypothetical protein
MVALIALSLLPLIPAGIAVITALRARPTFRVPLECHECGYSLIGNVTGICPECGTGRPDARSPQPFVTRDTRRMFSAGGIVMIVAVALHVFFQLARLPHSSTWIRHQFLGSLGIPAILCIVAYTVVLTGIVRARERGSNIIVRPAWLLTAIFALWVCLVISFAAWYGD